MKDPIDFVLNQEKTYGEISFFKIANLPLVLLANPDYIRHVLNDNSKNYYKGKKYKEIKTVMGEGLFTSEKKEWTWRRNMTSSAFNKKVLEGYIKPMVESVQILEQKWKTNYSGSKQFNMFTEMNELALDIAGRTMFGMGLYDFAPEASEILSTLFLCAEKRISGIPLPLWVPTPLNRKVKKNRNKFKTVLSHIIEERRKAYERGERQNNLLEIFFENQKSGKTPPDWSIIEETGIFLLAGHETTGIALTWTWSLLAQHPEVFQKLKAELKKTLNGRIPDGNDLNNLPYTLSVIKEALRLYPPIWVIARTALGDDEIGGYRIPAGTNISICPIVTHHSLRYWDKPEQFNPERFLGQKAEEINPYIYIPFGGGPRTCLGNNFALQEMLLIIAYLGQKFSPQLAPGFVPKPVSMVTMRPQGGMKMFFG